MSSTLSVQKISKLSACILVALTLLSPLFVSVVGASETEVLVRKLRSLRNTDRGFSRGPEWRKLEEQFFLQQKKEPKNAELRFYGAVLHEELGIRLESRSYLRDARDGFLSLHKMSPSSSWSEDGLHRAYILCTTKLRDGECASKARDQLKRQFPRSRYLALTQRASHRLPPKVRVVRRIPRVGKVVGRKPIIVLDPGHGGEDKGAVGVGGLREKDLALALTLEIQRALIARGCCEVLLTRERDTFVPLFERSQFANEQGAALFLSVHANADPHRSRRSSGFEVYVVSKEASPNALELVARENDQGAGATGDGLQNFLVDIYQRGATLASQPFAEHLHSSLKSSLKSDWPTVKARGVKKGPFYVLMGAEMPAALLEVLFVTHPKDALLLSDKRFRRAVGRSVAEAIDTYAAKHPGGTRVSDFGR